jgi:hypothetical protein
MKAKPTQLAQLQRALKLMSEVHKIVDDAVCADLSEREEALLHKILRSANKLLASYEDIL